jgi:hypothetical protein
MQRTVTEVVDVLKSLPPERVEEVYDFALFLKGRCGGPVDECDHWSEEDCREVVAASLHYADRMDAGEDS